MPYELGNTPSRQLETSGKEIDSKSRGETDPVGSRDRARVLGGGDENRGNSTTIFMGGTAYNSSDEEILQGMQGRFGDGEHRGFDSKKAIQKTTRVEVSYQA